MSRATDLTLAFISKRPDSAARVMASLPTEDAAAFTASIPTRYAIRLLVRLNTRSAASIVAGMEIEAAAAVIRDMEYSTAAAILRQVPDDCRQELLGGLSRRQRRNFETSLAFPADTVGAHMSMDIDTVLGTDTVADVLRLKKEQRDTCFDLTFVVDERRSLVGAVSLLSLLRHPEKTPVSELADTSQVSVSPQLRLSQIADFKAWQSMSQLPVVSRRGELLGAIDRQSTLSTDRLHAGETRSSREAITGATLAMMEQGVLGFIKLLVAAPPNPHRSGESDVS